MCSASLREGETHPGSSVIAETSRDVHPDSESSSQENSPNSETLPSETAIILPEERRQQNLFLNDDPPVKTENSSPGVKDEAGVALLPPEERKSLGAASRDASTNLLCAYAFN